MVVVFVLGVMTTMLMLVMVLAVTTTSDSDACCGPVGDRSGGGSDDGHGGVAVSYTHLTLPTILRV